jgi:hypothetical protein
MLSPLMRKLFTGFLFICLVPFASAHEPGTRWHLRVSDLRHQVRIEATVRLTGVIATETCIGGTWKRVIVETKSRHDEQFFPLAAPLAYSQGSGELTLGRTSVCDGYRFMSGKPGPVVRGDYSAVSIGSAEKLGYFTLRRIK